MKKVRFFITAILAVVMGVNSFAQMHDHSKMAGMSSTKTETIKVWGKCESCQARIEKAAKIDGITKASWNKDTKVLTLVYDPSMVNSDQVQKSIAAVGHDTEKYKAEDKIYNSLPSCCRYERKK